MAVDNYAPEKLTKKDVVKAWMRWIFLCEISNSYERLQTLSFCASLMPILQKLYKKKEDLVAALKRHLLFFNTQGIWGGIIHGVVIAMEEQKANGADIPEEAIIGLKTGLIGPFAGIGDTIDWATIRPIIVSLFLPLAATGNAAAALFTFLILTAIEMAEGYFFWMFGYRLGKESIMKILEGGWIQQLISGAGVLGMFMMGGLSAQFVKLSLAVKYMVGDKAVPLQQNIDKILPGLLPIMVVFSVYFYLVKKGPKYTNILVGIVAVAMIGALLNIF